MWRRVWVEDIGYMYFCEAIEMRGLKVAIGEAIQKWNT